MANRRVIHILLNSISIFSSLIIVKAQDAKFVNSADGRPLHVIRYAEVEGSPYWSDNFAKLEVKVRQTNKWVTYQRARFDCHKDELEYEHSPDKLMYLGYEQISEFRFGQSIFRCDFPKVNEWSGRHFYEVLHDGQTKLLKRINSRLMTEAIFGNVVKSSKFEREEQYFILKQAKMIRIKRKKSSILEVFSEQQDELAGFVKLNNIHFSSDDDLKKVVEFYETISPSKQTSHPN